MSLTAELPDAPSTAARRTTAPERFVFIDALRGLAALGVVACHIVPESPAFADVLKSIMRCGSLGVQVFFVISGFVIAYSVRNVRISGRFFANFALRRSIRLDPPYWATIFMILGLAFISRRLGNPFFDYTPTWQQVAAHFGYIQTFLGYEDLCVVFWTLRFEVLFYIAFIALLGMFGALARRHRGLADGTSSTSGGLWLFLPVALVSLALFVVGKGPGAARYFHMFVLGAMLWWTMDRRLPKPLVWSLLAAMAIGSVVGSEIELAVAVGVATMIYGVAWAGKLGTWLGAAPLQYLGRISYSLYLVHAPLCEFVLGSRGEEPLPTTLLWMFLAVVLSFGVAHLMYVLIEAPSVQWAKHFKPAKKFPQPTPVVATI